MRVHEDEDNRGQTKGAKMVCASAVAQRLPKPGIPEGVEVIVRDRTLSEGGVELLGRMLRHPPVNS